MSRTKKAAPPVLSYVHLFVTLRVLFEKLGENAPTAATAIKVFEPSDEPKLTVEMNACASFDDDGLVRVNRYERHDVTLPAWLSLEEWLRNAIAWKYAWALGVDPRWPEAWQRACLEFSPAAKLAVSALLNANLRSPFRQDLAKQMVEWMDTPAQERTHKSPLSPNQWDCIIHHHLVLEARSMQERIYWSRSTPDTGVAAGFLTSSVPLRGVSAERVVGTPVAASEAVQVAA